MSSRSRKPNINVRRLAGAARLSTAKIVRAAECAAGTVPIRELSVAVVDDKKIALLHEQFMGDDRPTDVLTFDLREDSDDEAIEGEIVVSVDTARREAARRGLDVREELLRYVVHGVLHLVGLDDHTPAERRKMRRAEDEVLRASDGESRDGSRTVLRK